jgi:hypothetical protein
MICDTKADFGVQAGQVTNCIFNGTGAIPSSCDSTPWDPPVTNFMAKSSLELCMTQFTPLQKNRMYYFLTHTHASTLRGHAIAVPQTYSTIQAAINASSAGDTILLAPGTYIGDGNWNLDLGAHLIVLKSSAGASQAIIDAQYSTNLPMLSMTTNGAPSSKVIGITFRHGYSYSSTGGILIRGASPIIENCNFEDCWPAYGGGTAIRVETSADESSPLIRGCSFTNNGGGGIGAVYVQGNSKAVISGCTFKHNYTAVVIAMNSDNDVAIDSCMFLANTGVVSSIETHSRTHLLGNTFFGDSGVALKMSGSYAWVNADQQLFANNLNYAISCGAGSYPVIQYCDFYQNLSGNFDPSGTCSPSVPGGTLLAVDPLFCNVATDDFTLRWDSPCAPPNLPAGYPQTPIGAWGVACGPATVLVSPASGAYSANSAPTLDWNNVSGAEQYHVQIDNNSNFSSPEWDVNGWTISQWTVTPELTDGIWYWRACAKDLGTGIVGPWSAGWSYQKYTQSGSSCPMLFTYDGEKYVEDNPLLTACEQYGYKQSVTDYYHVAKPVRASGGVARFQLRERDDEISYIEGTRLITVDHAPDVKVACDVNGALSLYRETVAPLSAVDNTLTNRLTEVLSEDGVVFSAKAPGYLDVTFPNKSGGIVINPVAKLPCPKGPGGGLSGKLTAIPMTDPELSIEVRDSLGQWVPIGAVPPRDQANQEFMSGQYPVRADAQTITFRIKWTKSYSTDVIRQIIPLPDTPAANRWDVSTASVSSADAIAKPVVSMSPEEPVILNKGDVLDFAFTCGEVPEGSVRDYVVVATGRYEPVGFSELPVKFSLYPNYPNPFNPSTTIQYDLAHPGPVQLSIYNALGQLVRTLVDGTQPAGRRTVEWDGLNNGGEPAASGLYFYRLRADEQATTRKMLLVK